MILRSVARSIGPRTYAYRLHSSRSITTLSNNSHIYVFSSDSPASHLLTLLPTSPPTPSLSLGTCTTLPPTPSSFNENPAFLPILHSVLRSNAARDPTVLAQAASFASPGGTAFAFSAPLPANHPSQRHRGKRDRDRRRHDAAGAPGEVRGRQEPGYAGVGGASAQGGMGGGGVGGWVHVSDERAPPDYGRIPYPEDIFGSVEVNGRGELVGSDREGDAKGNYQASGTYRIVTINGILGLPEYLMERLKEHLAELERRGKGG